MLYMLEICIEGTNLTLHLMFELSWISVLYLCNALGSVLCLCNEVSSGTVCPVLGSGTVFML